ncbi:MAG: ABC transporter substrate-binding protein [Dehalococcoidia bacterium]|nr:ABC transporter substrate-binding protein [Dehalococcoidia bacterium]
MRKFLLLALSVVLASGVFLTACSGSSKEEYRVGAIFAVTGNNSPLGTPEKQTAELLEQQINAAGGINGHPLKLVIYDTESDETKAVTLTKKLIEQDKVSAIIGPSSTGESLAIVPIVTEAKIPLISAAASIAIVDPAKDRFWVFKTPQSDVMAVKEIYAYLKAQGKSKIALITDSAGFGATGLVQLKGQAPNYGMTIVADEKFGSRDTDMTAQLTKIKGSGAEAIITWGTNPGPAVVAKNVRDLRIDIPLFNSHGIANPQFISLAGDAANGVIFPAGKLLVADQLPASDPQKNVLVKYKADFEAKYGAGTYSTFGGHAYDALMIVVNAMKKAGTDKAKIREEIEKTKGFAGTGGVFNMSQTDHNGLSEGAFVLIKVVDGKWTWLKQ